MADRKFRLVTRSDFDGVVCGTLLLELEMVESVFFAEPQDMQAGRIKITGNDIITNLPFVEGAHLCFDHHVSETQRLGASENRIIDPDAPSAARVVYRHYGGQKGFPNISTELMDAVDKADSAQYNEDEIMAPEGWTLLNFIIDPRTGLESVREFSIPKDELMERLMTYCRHNPIEEILSLPDVVERVAAYNLNTEFGELQIERCSRLVGKAIVTDLRREDKIEMVNRFMIYALHPDAEVSINVTPGPVDGICSISIARSILNTGSDVNVGLLALEQGGGGHAGAGVCRVANDRVDQVVEDFIQRING
ncbi:MAG: exopolyphosphatase [Rhodospirillales bacterium]|nr:exopolyphosphatase [Rhodospirillales bacterium]